MTPKEEAEHLMRELLHFAEHMLGKHGEFHPFGGMVRADGRVVCVGADIGREFPAGRDVVGILVDSFRNAEMRGGAVAVAVVANVTVKPPGKTGDTDAIRVSIDHQTDYSVHVFFPYTLDASGLARLEPPFASRASSFAFHGEPFA
jgi:hypothetical protein